MRRLSVIGLVLAFVTVTAGSAFGAGFALIEQSVKGLGTAFSGGAAVADDPSTVFFNPAGMTRLEGQQAQAAMHIIVPSAEFEKQEATNVVDGLTLPGPITIDGTLSGGNGGQAGEVGVAPNLYYTLNLGKSGVFGVSLNVPFGLATEYDKEWVGRYHAVESRVSTFNINPSYAYKINDMVSVGAGVSAQYIEATLSQMVDYGLFAFSAATDPTDPLFGTLSSELAAIIPNISNSDADIFSELEADDWSYGYNLGVLFELSDATRFGLSYRSEIEHDLEGDATFDIPSTYLASQSLILAGVASSVFADQGAYGSITLPASAQFSYFQQLNDQIALMADVMWTEWSSFDKLVINFEGTLASSPSVTTENWDDSWRYSVGTTYALDDKITLRGGLAYDETPIPDAYRTPRIPGADRFWVALGGGYKMGAWSFDAGYAHLFVDDGDINKVATPGSEDEGRGTLIGTYENSVDIFSVEASYKF